MSDLDGLRLDVVNDDLKLYQYADGLTFGTDALLLAAFVKGDRSARAVEFGGGTGIVSLLLAARNKVGRILSLEAQKEYADLIEKNIALNGLADRVFAVCGDLRESDACPGVGYDLVVTNPPYLRADSGFGNRSDKKNASRRELRGVLLIFAVLRAKNCARADGSSASICQSASLIFCVPCGTPGSRQSG